MGTGRPHTFVCPVYRRYKRQGEPRSAHQLTLTGKTRKIRGSGDGGGCGVRHWGDVAFEYECACGHRGWTRHPDIAHRAKHEGIQHGE